MRFFKHYRDPVNRKAIIVHFKMVNTLKKTNLSEELGITLGLYIDDFEICNPWGTSKKKHKVCGIYWVIANLPIKQSTIINHHHQFILLHCVKH